MTTATTIRRPLEGMLVLDLGQIYNGPYCGLLLGFMGAPRATSSAAGSARWSPTRS